jgi:hypothetical protein
VRCPECDLEIDTTEFDKGLKGAEDKLKRFGQGL